MKIAITGIAGTIGIAFTKLLHDKHELIGVDRNEQNVARLLKDFDIPVRLCDFDEFDFKNQEIDLVIHLAAFKHIDLCQRHVTACVTNNVIKTQKLFENAHKHDVDILFMSTDKAVEPSSMYGYSKALAEGMALEYGGCFARSGNVMDSNGSVLQIWDDAIEKLLPITITHKDMRRFFITPEHLVERIWELYLSGVNVIIPEMDLDILLVDLAKEKLKAHGYTLEDYPGGIKYIGLRPGEKLVEKLQ